MEELNYFRKCSACKNEINFGAIYQKCSVSSCRKNVYCSVTCWDVHVPVLNHKSAWAEEERAPSKQSFLNNLPLNNEKPRRRIIVVNKTQENSVNSNIPKDILIVASKLKAYIKNRSDMNVSANVLERLSDIVRNECNNAIEQAQSEGRKTVMDRDFK